MGLTSFVLLDPVWCWVCDTSDSSPPSAGVCANIPDNEGNTMQITTPAKCQAGLTKNIYTKGLAMGGMRMPMAQDNEFL